MRILIVSDSHGNTMALEEVLAREPAAELLIHLGDGLSDLVAVQRACRCPQSYMVRGNCDYAPDIPSERLCGLEGQLALICHGNGYEVKLTHGALLGAAKRRGADIALFGHTHTPWLSRVDGVWLFNPGSLSRSAVGRCTYGILTVEKGKEPVFEHKVL